MSKPHHSDVILALAIALLAIVLLSGVPSVVQSIGAFKTHFTLNAAIIIFIATQLFTTAWRLRDEHLLKSRIASGLYHEIERNLIEQERDKIDEAVVQSMKTFVTTNDGKIPMVVLSFNDVFYQGVSRDLPILHKVQIQAVNDFYFCVTQLRNAVASIESKAFLDVNVQSRTEVFDIILVSYNETVKSGQKALELLSKKPPKGGFLAWLSDLLRP